MEYLLLAVGLFVLIKGADYLIEGASSIARKFGLPSILVGLTIVAFGTSLPEFLINIFAASRGSADLALGNVIGSNLANILLVLAVVALVCPAQVKRPTVWKEVPFGFWRLRRFYLFLCLPAGATSWRDGRGYSFLSLTLCTLP